MAKKEFKWFKCPDCGFEIKYTFDWFRCPACRTKITWKDIWKAIIGGQKVTKSYE